jgi:molybdenum cofactor biosynthesis protein B
VSAGEGESASVHRHRREAPRALRAAVLTVSDTRTPETDTGGALLAELLEEAGHRVVRREIVSDDVEAIREAARRALEEPAPEAPAQALLVTGGTGMAPRDVTPEALRPLLDREIPGFGELFRMLSWEEIGPAAMVSRAFAGMRGGCPVFALPGSRGAIRLAMTQLVLPELGHLAGEGGKGAAGPAR